MNTSKPLRIETDVHAAYERWSETYDAQPNATRDLSSLALKRLVPDLSGLSIVEGGCGTGANSSWLAPMCKQLIGLDSSEGMLSVARSKVQLPHVHFIRHDIREPWPVVDATADLVLINLVLEHIEVLEPVFRHAAQVMQLGALLIISELHPNRVAAGARARIKRAGEEDESIVNFVHPVEDYVTAADAVGLRFRSSVEWPKHLLNDRPVDTSDSEPLVLTLCFGKP